MDSFIVTNDESIFNCIYWVNFSRLGIAQENPYVYLKEGKFNGLADEKCNAIPNYINFKVYEITKK